MQTFKREETLLANLPTEPCKKLTEEPIYSNLLNAYIEYMEALLEKNSK